jgi:valacyclovir hydrolase
MPFATVRGQHLWYEDAGQGEAVLLLHGFTGTARSHLGGLIDFLSRTHRVLAPDLRGYGRSEPKPRVFTPDFYVEDAKDAGALLDALGIDHAHILGYSDGGETAVLVAIERPDRAGSVVAWGTAGLLGAEIASVADDYTDLCAWETKRAGWRDQIIAQHGADSFEPIVLGWARAIQAMLAAGGDVSLARASTIRCPVLLINGEHDMGNPAHLARQLADRIPNCTFEIWPGLGHPVHQEAAERFNARVLQFLHHVEVSQKRN